MGGIWQFLPLAINEMTVVKKKKGFLIFHLNSANNNKDVLYELKQFW